MFKVYDPYKKNNQYLTALQLVESMKKSIKTNPKSCENAEYDLSTLEDMIKFLKVDCSLV